MTSLAQLQKKQEELERLQRDIERMKASEEVQKEMAFIEDLNQLLSKYNKTLADLAPMVPAKVSAAAPAAGRRQRKLKVYVNPTTGEKIETRGGNHKVLKAWKAEHGNDVVEGWLQ